MKAALTLSPSLQNLFPLRKGEVERRRGREKERKREGEARKRRGKEKERKRKGEAEKRRGREKERKKPSKQG